MTVYPFVIANPTVLFTFQPTLDGSIHTVQVFWNVWAQRWYFRVLDQFGDRIVTRPLVGSQALQPIVNLAWSDGVVMATTKNLLPYRPGTVVELTLTDNSPDGYNGGPMPCVSQGSGGFTYPVMVDPGMPSVFGSYSFDVNLIWSYFTTSKMIFRPSTGSFEVSP